MSNWIILTRYELTPILENAYRNRFRPLDEWLASTATDLIANGNLNGGEQPFILLEDHAAGGELQVMLMEKSIDWTLDRELEALGRLLAPFGVTASFMESAMTQVRAHLAYHFTHEAAALVQSCLDHLNDDTSKMPLPAMSPEEIKEEFEKVMGPFWAPLPAEAFRPFDELFEEAKLLAYEVGLNAPQLFVEDRLELLMAGSPQLAAFKALPKAVQDGARRWVVRVFKWEKFYPAYADSAVTSTGDKPSSS